MRMTSYLIRIIQKCLLQLIEAQEHSKSNQSFFRRKCPRPSNQFLSLQNYNQNVRLSQEILYSLGEAPPLLLQPHEGI
ncbi:hypothetical protein FGO68_gene5889 [Halteria grandinella]|uniref:Uncharacterized protein n=1 Tax=Halteria grandinella TaxID=5974 RepID=A0A8J8NUZ7_HALGN|nr:hypothetical protein FGO68_gene5889 [Halteria grandinella]